MPASLPDGVRTAYVFATGYRPTRFTDHAAAARNDPAWEYTELDAAHWLMFSHPDEVARIILSS